MRSDEMIDEYMLGEMLESLRQVEPNEETLRLRDMLDEAGIEWHGDRDVFCHTNDADEDHNWTFSAICGYGAYGTIELWTRTMKQNKEEPIGLDTAEEAFALIREEVGA